MDPYAYYAYSILKYKKRSDHCFDHKLSIYEIVAKSHDDVMTTGNHQNRIQWPRFSTWENFSCKNIHKLSIYEIFLKRHGDVIPTGNDQNRVQ